MLISASASRRRGVGAHIDNARYARLSTIAFYLDAECRAHAMQMFRRDAG